MEQMIHWIAQYLAVAGINYVKHEADDSHTNLGFSLVDGVLTTRTLGETHTYLRFHYTKFRLEWENNKAVSLYELDGKTHDDVLQWIRAQALTTFGKDTYTYDLHYELPYKPITGDYTYKLENKHKLNELLHFRILAQLVLEGVLKEVALSSEIRIWPHHLDTGAYAQLPSASGIAVGLGLAIPDTLCDSPYFYIAAYQGHETIDVEEFASLSEGRWVSQGFTGAICSAKDISQETGVQFFKEALTVYKNHI